MEAEANLRNFVLNNKNRAMVNVRNVNTCINIPPSRTFRLYRQWKFVPTSLGFAEDEMKANRYNLAIVSSHLVEGTKQHTKARDYTFAFVILEQGRGRILSLFNINGK
jgi:hypothetical protein